MSRTVLPMKFTGDLRISKRGYAMLWRRQSHFSSVHNNNKLKRTKNPSEMVALDDTAAINRSEDSVMLY